MVFIASLFVWKIRITKEYPCFLLYNEEKERKKYGRE